MRPLAAVRKLLRRTTLPGDPGYNATAYRLPSGSGKVGNTIPGSYLGYTVRETAGGAATIVLYDSAVAPNVGTTPILEEITLGSFESTRDDYARPGRGVTSGIWAIITGTVEGSVFQ